MCGVYVVGHVAGVGLALHPSLHAVHMAEPANIAGLRGQSHINVVEAVIPEGLLLLLELPTSLTVDLIDHGALGTVVFAVFVTGATQTRGCSVTRGS